MYTTRIKAAMNTSFPLANNDNHAFGWSYLRSQLLLQWSRLTPSEVDATGADPSQIAALIQQKYGIAPQLTENYLRNFTRTLPQ